MHFVNQQDKCRSRQIFRGAKDFCPQILQTRPKKTPKNDPQQRKKRLLLIFGAIFLKSKHIKDNFAKMSLNLSEFPQTRPRKLQKSTSKIKKTSASVFEHHLFQVKAHQMISQRISNFFPQIS